jgi:putative endonuclease
MSFFDLFNKTLPITDSQKTGAIGESAAANFLKKAGLKVLFRNWRLGKYEIDLVCEEKGILVFVEVRTRKTGAMVSGYQSITARKRKVLRQGAFEYMNTLQKRPRTYRYDFVEVRLENGKPDSISHFRNADIF